MIPVDMNILPTRIALVCDWLTSWGGAERVMAVFHEMFPEAPIYTTIYDRANLPMFDQAHVETSFLQTMPGAKKHHPWYYPWMPRVFESMDLRDYDIVISSSHSCAKGIITKPETLHVSYCHSPPRYLWDDSHRYLQEYPWPSVLKRFFIPGLLNRLRLWDRAAADRVDHFVANSHYIAHRIHKYYHRDATVMHPPVEMEPFKPLIKKDDYFLAVGRLIPYKRFDLIVEAFNRLQWPLKIVGVGNQYDRLKRCAGSNVEFLEWIPEADLRELYRRAQALVFPQLEDFGLTAVEAMAQGCPVVAYGRGGALETVKEDVSGLFFKEQSVESLIETLEAFRAKSFKPAMIREHAESFRSEIFKDNFQKWLEGAWQEWCQ